MLTVVMLTVVMLTVAMLTVVMLTVVMLSVKAPKGSKAMFTIRRKSHKLECLKYVKYFFCSLKCTSLARFLP
jgi:hypothetical protein